VKAIKVGYWDDIGGEEFFGKGGNLSGVYHGVFGESRLKSYAFESTLPPANQMARQRFDIGSKWPLHNQGRGAAIVGGLKNVLRTEPMPGEVIQNRRYPDGLLRAYLDDDPKPHHLLIEIATYPEKRALKQALDDLTLAYSALGHLPDMLMLVLRPKGQIRIEGRLVIESEFGCSELAVKWKVVELWTLPAEQFLAEGDVGVMPWVPLMRFDGPAESLLARCADKIERKAGWKQREDLLVISEVMAGLRYPGLDLTSIFGEKKTMIESPVLQKWLAEAQHVLILDTLKDRFGLVPHDVKKGLRAVLAEKKLRRLNRIANKCPDLDTFREALLS